ALRVLRGILFRRIGRNALLEVRAPNQGSSGEGTRGEITSQALCSPLRTTPGSYGELPDPHISSQMFKAWREQRALPTPTGRKLPLSALGFAPQPVDAFAAEALDDVAQPGRRLR